MDHPQYLAYKLYFNFCMIWKSASYPTSKYVLMKTAVPTVPGGSTLIANDKSSLKSRPSITVTSNSQLNVLLTSYDGTSCRPSPSANLSPRTYATCLIYGHLDRSSTNADQRSCANYDGQFRPSPHPPFSCH